MELLNISVKTKQSLTLPYEEVQIMPIGDVQLGSEGVQADRLKKQIDWALKQENVYFIGMGDYIDVMSPSNRAAWKGLRKYDAVIKAMKESVELLNEKFLDLVDGTHGKWLGLLEGHHFYEFEDGTTNDHKLCTALGAPFLGSCAFVRLAFSRQDGRVAQTCTIWAHHGAGNGIMPHSSLNKLYHIAQNFEADIYLIGHQTKKPAVKIPTLYMDRSGVLRAKSRLLCGTGGFSEGYTAGSLSDAGHPRGGYVEQRMLSPVYLGSPLIKIRPVHTKERDRIDINCEI